VGAWGYVSSVVAAFVGATAVTAVIWMFSRMVRSNIVLIIIGIMMGYLASSGITLLNYFATEEGVKSFAVWGMGNFGNVAMSQMPFFATVTLLATGSTLLLMKPLNALLMGEHYAESLGIDVRRARNILLVLTGILTAVVTAFCGPIAFIALAVPHIGRLMLRTSNHRQLLPVTILTGSAIALLCNVLTILPGDGSILPLNAVTPLIGAPVIIYVIIKR
jgi:iron complex transport system permease protein